MGNRLSKIYTRTGDAGTTGLGDGSRVPKDSPRVEAYGSVDELNSTIGLLRAERLPAELETCLHEVQHHLFDLGAELCIPGHSVLKPEHVTYLEQVLDAFNADLSPLKEFILPGGGRAASLCHVVRCQCRVAERRAVSLAAVETVNEPALAYLNRLSDLMFVAGRVCAAHSGNGDVLWEPKRGLPTVKERGPSSDASIDSGDGGGD